MTQPKHNKLVPALALALFLAILLLPRLGLCADEDVAQIYQYLGGWYNKFLLPIGTTLAGFVIMFGGIIYSTSGGDPSKAGKGKDLIYGAISGLALLILAAFIVRMITT